MLAADGARRDLVLRFARFRRAGRARPLRPDRTQGAVRVDGYWYNGKAVDCLEKNAEIVAQMPSLLKTVVVPYLADAPGNRRPSPMPSRWNDIAPFDAQTRGRSSTASPSIIRCSSCSPRAPPACPSASSIATAARCCSTSRNTSCTATCGRGDRLFYFTTCGWMMWNWLVSGLAVGATLLLYDGSPFAARGNGAVRLRRGREA